MPAPVSAPEAPQPKTEKLDAGNQWQDYALDVPLSILIATGLPAGVPLQFRVRGKNSRGTTDWSDPVTATL